MAKSAKKVIAEAGALLRDPAYFTSGALARNRDGNVVRPNSSAAVKWCAIGALYRAANARPEARDGDVGKVAGALATLDLTSNRLFRKPISSVCDDLGHESVMQVYGAAWRLASDEVAKDFGR